MSWDDLAAGQGCPFDAPRKEPNNYWDSVSKLSVSTLCLLKNQAYRGHCILIFGPRHVTRLDQLTTADWDSFMSDLNRAVAAIASVCEPDHLNVASEGNVIRHLHWQIIPRYKNDPRWGAPIAMTTQEEMTQVAISEMDRMAMIAAMRACLERP